MYAASLLIAHAFCFFCVFFEVGLIYAICWRGVHGTPLQPFSFCELASSFSPLSSEGFIHLFSLVVTPRMDYALSVGEGYS